MTTCHGSVQPLVTTYANGVVETRSYDANRLWLPGQEMGIVTTAPNAGTGGAALFAESCTRNDLAAFSGPDHPGHVEPALWQLDLCL